MRDIENNPEYRDLTKKIINKFHGLLPRIIGESEKSPVLVGVTSIENELEKLIQHFLIDSPSGIDDLFETGALSNFSSKISIARRIGLINNELQYAIDVMRKIRNSVTRSEFPDIYNSSQLKDLIDDLLKRYRNSSDFLKIENALNVNEEFTLEKFKNENKTEFILLVFFLIYTLETARYIAEKENYKARLIVSFP